MSPVRIVAALAVLATLVTGCADTDDDVATSEDQQEQSPLSVAGDGMNPIPPQLDMPMPWVKDDFRRLPPPKPLIGDLRNPLGPKGDCSLRYLELHNPAGGEPLEVPIVVCN